MSDSKDTNELDSYGVWVKTPPKTVDSSGDNKTTDSLDDFNLDTDLPDFSDLDVVDEPQTGDFDGGETALSSEELSAIADTADEQKTQEKTHPVNENGEEEISLDEFLDGGVFETGPDEDKIKEKEAAGLASPNQENNEASAEEKNEPASTETSADDISVEPDTQDIAAEDNTAPEPESAPSGQSVDDDIFNIDLSFDDGDTSSTESGSTAPLSESSSADTAYDSPAGTEDVDLSEFGLDDLNTDDNIPTDVSTETHESPAETGGMESIDLSEFGFDDTDSSDSSPAADTGTAEKEPVEKESSEPETSLPVDEPAEDSAEEPEAATTMEPSGNDGEPAVASLNGTDEEEAASPVSSETEDESAKTEDSSEINPMQDDSLSMAADIPDTFDEEASALLDDSSLADDANEDEKTAEFADSIKAPILDETVAEEEKPSTQMTAIFSQIVSELSSLKNEISALKNDFEKIKNLPQNNVPLEAPEPKEESKGFFSNTDEDDTIALSTDELDNILNTADITAAPSEEKEDENISQGTEANSGDEYNKEPQAQEEPLLAGDVPAEETADETSDESFPEPAVFDTDFVSDDNGTEETPSLDTLDDTEEAEPSEELPEEISVPKTDDILSDDILVESSPSDLIDEGPASSGNAAEKEKPENIEEIPGAEEDEPALETNESPEEEDPFALYEKADPPISDSLTDEKIDYLEATPAAGIEQGQTQTENENKSGISSEMTDEIKSVLSYMDQLLENLPEEKIAEFARSEQFDTYKKLFKELGLA